MASQTWILNGKEKFCRLCTWVFHFNFLCETTGSLNNHDDDGNKSGKKFAYLTFKNVVLHALREQFSVLFILQPILS